MKFDSTNLINDLTQYLFIVFIFGLILIFSPWQITNVFNTPKWLFLNISAIIFTLIWGVKMLSSKQPSIINKKNGMILGGFFLATILSMVINNPNKIVAFLGKGTMLLSTIAIIVSVSNLLEADKLSKLKNKMYWTFLSLAGLLSVWEIFNFFNISNKILGDKLFTSQLFTPIGSQINLLIFLIIAILATTPKLLSLEKMSLNKIAGLVLSAVIFTGIILSTIQILPNKPASPAILPVKYGWFMAVDQLKDVRNFLIGFGPNNFDNNFNFRRPAVLNVTKYWKTNFPESSNEFFNTFSTIGILGLIPFLLLLLFLIRNSASMDYEIKLPLYFIIASMFVIPASTTTWSLLAVFAALVFAKQDKFTIKDSRVSQLTGLISVLVMLVLGFFTARVALAEIYYGKGLHAFNMNKVKDTLVFQEKAAQLNPYSSEYRKTYAQTNVAIASALASKKKVSDKEKDQIKQLVDNAIKEAKAAVILRPNRSNYWNNLATIYSKVSNILPEAKNWTVQAYIQTIKLEPTNPILRLKLAQFLIANKAIDQGIAQLNTAASLKPDYTNVYYNLAYAYSLKKQYPQAYLAARKTLSLMSPQNPQYQTVKNDVENLYKLVPDEYKQASKPKSDNAQSPKDKISKPEQPPASNTKINVKDNQRKELQPPNGSDKATLEEITPAQEASKTAIPIGTQSGTINQ